MLLERFKYGFEKYLSLNEPTFVTVERKSDTKEAEVPTIFLEIPDETVDLDMGYYPVVCVLLNFKRGGFFLIETRIRQTCRTCSRPRRDVRSNSLVCSEKSLLIVGIGPILDKELELIFRSNCSDRTFVYT